MKEFKGGTAESLDICKEYFKHTNSRKSYLLTASIYNLKSVKAQEWFKVFPTL
jgi:hypothetical protein